MRYARLSTIDSLFRLAVANELFRNTSRGLALLSCNSERLLAKIARFFCFAIKDLRMEESGMSPKRRFLLAASSVAGGIATLGAATPFFLSMFPSARARAAGAPVEVDISKVEAGMMIRVEWRGQPVWVLHRTPEMLEDVKKMDSRVADPASESSEQPPYAKNEYRSSKPEYLILVGICTHLGCSPSAKLQAGAESGLGEDWLGGFFCPCHGSKFDLAGRVLKDVPAPRNLRVPPYVFVNDARLVVGEDKGTKGA